MRVRWASTTSVAVTSLCLTSLASRVAESPVSSDIHSQASNVARGACDPSDAMTMRRMRLVVPDKSDRRGAKPEPCSYLS